MLMTVAASSQQTPMRITTEILALGFAMLSALGGIYVSLNAQLTQIQERQVFNSQNTIDIKERMVILENRLRLLELNEKEDK